MGLEQVLIFGVLLLGLLSKTNGKRNFIIYLDSCNTSYNPSYVKFCKCGVDKTYKAPRGFLEAELNQEFNGFRYSFDLVFLKKNNERYTIFNSTDNDGCQFMEGKVGPTMLKIFRDVLSTFGRLPEKCPIPKGYRFVFKDVTLDPEKYPPYMPDAKFAMEFKMFVGNEKVLFFEGYGEVIQKGNKRWLG